MSSCLNPRLITNPAYSSRSADGLKKLRFYRCHVACDPNAYPEDYQIIIPCGKCVGCIKDRAREWRVRLLHEHEFGRHFNCICLTLTISDQYYDNFQDRSQASVFIRSFLDRLRYYCKGRKLPKRFFVTELGEKRDRLHFHGFMWDVTFSYDDLRRCWPYGFIWIKPYRSPKQLTYATKYITKAAHGGYVSWVYASPGLGKGYTESVGWNKYHHSDPDYYLRYICRCGSFVYSMPQYYRRKMFTDDEKYYFKVLLSKSPRPFEKHLVGQKFVDPLFYARYRYRLYQDIIRFQPKVLKPVFSDSFSLLIDSSYGNVSKI